MSGLYEGREQSLVKHYILQKYLESFAHKVGSWADSITYVDCFSGPWNVQSPELKDSSFAIALQELRRARETWRELGRDLKIRCFFLEEDPEAYAQLKAYADQVTDAEVMTKNARLAESVEDIVSFVKKGGKGSFPFVFIDPTGWTGFELDVITPLLKLNPCEVLINFMTSFVRRFIQSEDSDIHQSFVRMYGRFAPDLGNLAKEEREEAAIAAYTNLVGCTGDYRYVCKAIVLHPEIDKTHFHLIYATRHPAGVEVFKKAESLAMGLQQKTRAEIRGRREEAKEGWTLFQPEDMYGSGYLDVLRTRYLSRARMKIQKLLADKIRVKYDDAWVTAMMEPLAQEADLKHWIEEWKSQLLLSVQNLMPKQRVPQRGKGNVLLWNGTPTENNK